MRIELDSNVWCGRAIDLSHAEIAGETIVAAIRDENDPRIECERPGALHEHVGLIRSGMGLRTRTALAAAARTQGRTAPQDETRAQLGERLDALSETTDETVRVRKRLAATGDDIDIDRHRERVARLQGQVQILRKSGDEGEARALLVDAIRELSEIETERAAAEQELERARQRQRQRRDRQDERLALEDRAANLARAARRHLVRELEPAFKTVLKTVPGATATGFDADPVTAALAIARIGSIDAPVVLECDRFRSATAAADWLDAPVIKL